ncbi:MAG: CDP-alcohol phosphatidyltransferase family protein [Candidatus Micrarchaeia archaeon]
MRSADFATVFRVLLVFISVYLIILKINPLLIIFLLLIAFILDGVDGYLAIREESKNTVSFISYINSFKKSSQNKKKIKEIKESISKKHKHGPRMDVAGDRAIEYALWSVFIYLNVLPFFVILIVIFRHSFVDAIMGAKGTSNKMKTKLGRIVYSSSIGRGGVNVVKFLTFSYLTFVYVSDFPIFFGYILTGILLLYIVVRGVAEVVESLHSE